MIRSKLFRNMKLHIPLSILAFLWGGSAFCATLSFDGPLDFGNIKVGSSKKLMVTIKNNSRRKIRLDSHWFNNSYGFSYEEGSCKMNGYNLQAKKTCNFYLIYKPQEEIINQTEFVIGYYRANGWTWYESSLDIKGEGSLEATPPPSTSGKVTLNLVENQKLEIQEGKDLQIDFLLKNETSDKIRIDEYWFKDSTSSWKLKSSTCNAQLDLGKSCLYSLNFVSSKVGLFDQSLTVGHYLGDAWDWKEVIKSFSITVIAGVPSTPPPTVPAKGRLSVSGNKIVDENGNQVVLKGVNIADPEHLNTKENERPGISADSVATLATKDFYAKVVRLPILPGDPNYPREGWFGPYNGGQKYFDNHIDPLVKSLTSQGIYVIIDLHYISNYTGLFPKVSEFWRFMAPKYRDNPYVLYELMNEPILPDNWDQFKKEIAAPTVKIIRELAPDNIIIVGSPYWSSHLQGIVDNPIESTNIVYTAHIYSNQRESTWEKNYGDVIKKFPVMVTEWGFETGGTEGGDLDYGTRFEAWMNSHKLSWTAWCFDNRWGPRMFDLDWNLKGGQGGMGQFVKDKLKENHDRSIASEK